VSAICLGSLGIPYVSSDVSRSLSFTPIMICLGLFEHRCLPNSDVYAPMPNTTYGSDAWVP
jgi:hypothetical protein